MVLELSFEWPRRHIDIAIDRHTSLSPSLSLANKGSGGTRGNRIGAIEVQGVILLMFLLNVFFVILCLNDITYELGGTIRPGWLAD